MKKICLLIFICILIISCVTTHRISKETHPNYINFFETNKKLIIPDAVAFSPDNKHVLISDEHGAGLYSIETGMQINFFETNKKFIIPDAVAFSPDGKQVLITDEHGAILYEL